MDKKDIYKTNLLTLASFLYTKRKLTFEGLDKSDPTQIFFKFAPKEKAIEYADEYFDGGLPLNLFKNYKVLKDMVFEIKRNLRQTYSRGRTSG